MRLRKLFRAATAKPNKKSTKVEITHNSFMALKFLKHTNLEF